MVEQMMHILITHQMPGKKLAWQKNNRNNYEWIREGNI
jgi:hypothetical protein